jgi:lipopolysaccharide export LptBFGC system permease protein LptF
MLSHTYAQPNTMLNHTHVKLKPQPNTHHTQQNQTTHKTYTCKTKTKNHQTHHQPNQPQHIFILKFKYKDMLWLVGLVVCLVVFCFGFTCVCFVCGLVLLCVVCVWLWFEFYMCMVKHGVRLCICMA